MSEFDNAEALATFAVMTKPREYKRYAHREPQQELPLNDYVPFVREDETPIEVTRVYVTALPTRPRTGIVRMCAKNYSQAFVISTTLMHSLCEDLVRQGLQIEKRARRGS